eukprot:766586-Hanusia_phi.AAC.6
MIPYWAMRSRPFLRTKCGQRVLPSQIPGFQARYALSRKKGRVVTEEQDRMHRQVGGVVGTWTGGERWMLGERGTGGAGQHTGKDPPWLRGWGGWSIREGRKSGRCTRSVAILVSGSRDTSQERYQTGF